MKSETNNGRHSSHRLRSPLQRRLDATQQRAFILDFVNQQQRFVRRDSESAMIIECYCHDPINKVGAHYHVVNQKEKKNEPNI